jgi:hypothetical protein
MAKREDGRQSGYTVGEEKLNARKLNNGGTLCN